MVFVGFGLLMSFLKKASYSGMGMVLMLAAFALQWTILVMGFFMDASNAQSTGNKNSWVAITLGIDNLIWGLYGCVSVLVGLGASLGRIPPFAQLIFVFFFIPIYGLNWWINSYFIVFFDLGGSIHVFTFGAFFGAAFSWIYSANNSQKKQRK